MKKFVLLFILACSFVGLPCFSECKADLHDEHVKPRTNTEVIFTYPSMFKLNCESCGISMDELVEFIKKGKILSDEQFYNGHGKVSTYSKHMQDCLNVYFDGCVKVLKLGLMDIDDTISCMVALSPTEQEYISYIDKKLTKIKTKTNKSYSDKNSTVFMPGDLDSYWDFYDLCKKLSNLPPSNRHLWEMVWADVHLCWLMDQRLSDTLESIQRGTYR